MDSELVMDGIVQLNVWHWLAVAGALVVIDLLLGTTLLIWASLAALITALILWGFPGLAIPWQLSIFAGLTMLLLGATRAWMRRHPGSPRDATLNRRAEALVGTRRRLASAIEYGEGELTIDDTRWRIHGPDLPVGRWVVVTAVDGNVLQVAAASAPGRD